MDPAQPPKVVADLAAVIVTATARLITNPSGDPRDGRRRVASQTHNEFRGFNLAELMVLNGHRRRCA